MPDDRLSGLLETQPQESRLAGLLDSAPVDVNEVEKTARDNLRIAVENEAPIGLVEDYRGLILDDYRHIADPSEPDLSKITAPTHQPDANPFGVLTNKKISLKEQIRRMDAADWVSILDPFKIKSIGETSEVYLAIQRLQRDSYEQDLKTYKKVFLQAGADEQDEEAFFSIFSPQSVKQQDIEIVENYLYRLEEEQTRGFTFGAKVFRGATYLPGWMIAFLISGGAAELGTEGAKNAAVRLLGDYAKTRAGQVVLKTAGWAGGAITRASLGMPALVLDETLKNRMPKQMHFGPNNELIVDIEGDNWATAILKGWGTVVIEAASESAGKGIGKAASAITQKLPFGKQLVEQLAKLRVSGKLDDVFTLTGWNGFLQEVGEERLATILHAIAGTQDFGKPDGDMWERLQSGITRDVQGLPVELTVLALPGTARYAAAKISPQQGIPEKPIIAQNEINDDKMDSYAAKAGETVRRAFNQTKQPDIEPEKIEAAAGSQAGFIGDLLHNIGIKSKDGYEAFEPKDFRNIYKFVQLPQDIARTFPEFEPLYKLLGSAQYREAITLINAFNEGTQSYFKLKPNDRQAIDKVLLEAEQNPQATYGPKTLSEKGLTAEQAEAFRVIRLNLDHAKNLIYNLMKDFGVQEDKLREFDEGIKNYVPHKWYGNWAVVVKEKIVTKEKPPTKKQAIIEAQAFIEGREIPPAPTETKELEKPRTIFMAAVNYAQRFNERDRLKNLYPNADVIILERKKIPYKAFQTAPPWAVQRMVDLALEKAQVHPDTAADVREALNDLYKAKGFGTHFIRRQGTPGHTEDLMRPLAEYFNGFGWYYAKILTMHQLPKALGQISAQKTPNLYRYALSYVKYMLGEQQEFQKAKRFAYVWYLWGRISSAALNATQSFVTGWPVLSTQTSFALPKLLQAMARTAIPGDAGLTAEEKNLLGEMERRGYFETSLSNEIAAYTPNPLLREVHGAIEKGMAMVDVFRLMERFNRRAMAVALWDSGIRDIGKIHELVNAAHWEYGKGNRPVLWRGYLSPIMTFRSWYLHYLTWTKNEIKAGRISPLAKSWLSLFVFGGLNALPLFGLVAYIWRKVFDEDLETEIRKATGSFGNVVMRGVPTTIGIDFSESVGPGDIMPENPKDVIGVFADLYDRGRMVGKALENQDYYRAAEIAAPQVLRSPLSAYRLYGEGAFTMSGRPVLDLTTGEQVKLTGGEAIVKGLGFQPARLAKQRHIAEVIEQQYRARQELKTTWANRLQLAALEKDKQAIMDVIAEIERYNKRMVKRGREDEVVTPKEMQNMMTVRGLPANIPPQYMWPAYKKMLEAYKEPRK